MLIFELDEWMYELERKAKFERFENFQIGFQLLLKKNYDKASALFQEFLKKFPDDPHAKYFANKCKELAETKEEFLHQLTAWSYNGDFIK